MNIMATKVYATFLLQLLVQVSIFQGTFGQRTGALRFYPTSSSTGGRLEMYYSYGWYPFTITGFNMHDADVACKTLGFLYASRYAKVATLGYSRSYARYSIYHVNCPSNAVSFSSCTYSRTYSSSSRHYYDVGLQCSNSKSRLRLVSSSGYSSGISSGRLEIYINNTWGTVCDDNFDAVEATVACRQLRFLGYVGYSSADATIGYAVSFNTVPIWLDNLSKCTTASSDLRKCTNIVGDNDCTHSEDIILTCNPGYATSEYYYTTSSIPSQSGDLRLVSDDSTSTTRSSGRLEIYYYQYSFGYAWTPFCYDSFSSHEADLACKWLGFMKASKYGLVGNMGFNKGSGSYSINSSCLSYDTTLSSCNLRAISSCSHTHDVALRCFNDAITTSSTASQGSVRLVSYNNFASRYHFRGRLEVFIHQSSGYNWTSFCYSYFNSKYADIACRQLGYNQASDYGIVSDLGYEQGSGSLSISFITCPSHAKTLSSCSFATTSSCSHYDDVAVSCTYDTVMTSPGLIIGLTIGSVFLFSVMLLGGALCAFVIRIAYHKKGVHSPRTTVVENEVQNAPNTANYRMSDLAAKENEYGVHTFRPAHLIQNAPNMVTPVTMQHDTKHPQNGQFTDLQNKNTSSTAAEINVEDDANDSYAFDDEKPLIS